MLLTDLADAARKSGLKVIETPGWKNRGHGQMSAVRTIVCHHTAGPRTGNMPSLNTIIVGRPGLEGPLSQLGLGRDGTVYVIAAGLAWHAGAVRETTMGNAYAIGIEAEATGTSDWPDVQMDAYARLCRALCEHYAVLVVRVLGHKEVCSPVGRKIDPNFDMPAFRRRITNLEDDMAITDWTEAEREEFQRLVRGTDIEIVENGQRVTKNLGRIVRELEESQDRVEQKVDRIIKKIGA